MWMGSGLFGQCAWLLLHCGCLWGCLLSFWVWVHWLCSFLHLFLLLALFSLSVCPGIGISCVPFVLGNACLCWLLTVTAMWWSFHIWWPWSMFLLLGITLPRVSIWLSVQWMGGIMHLPRTCLVCSLSSSLSRLSTISLIFPCTLGGQEEHLL